MKILVTGSEGFIGSHLKLPGETIGFDIINGPQYDVTNFYWVESFWVEDKPDIVVHLAGNPRGDLAQRHPWWDARINIGGTINALRASLENDVKLFIYASTCQIYDVNAVGPMPESTPCDPRTPYAFSKYAGEFYCKNFERRGLNVCILRFFNIYGPGQSAGYVVPDLIERALYSNEVKVLGPYNDSRDFIYVEDVAKVIRKVVEQGEEVSGEIFNIGSGTETFIGDLCETIAQVLGKEIKFDYAERPLGKLPGRYQAEISKATELLNWEPETTLEEGIESTVYWKRRP